MYKMMDVECYTNFFLIKFYVALTGVFTSYRMTQWQPLDRAGVRREMENCTLVTFNGLNYDIPMVTLALSGMNCAQLKQASDAMIVLQVKHWDLLKQHGVSRIYPDHIDLIEVTPGMGGLKKYAARAHSRTIQDLPYDPSALLTLQQMDEVDTYCGYDLVDTADVFDIVKPDIDIRIMLTEQYGIDLRSKSDAQIAEAAFKKLLNLDYEASRAMIAKAQLPAGHQFMYKAPAFIQFTTPQLQNTLAMIHRSPFTIQANGSPEMTKELAECRITIGGSVYRLGSGGLHSSEESKSHRADADTEIVDVDAASFYPFIISILRMFPPQIGEQFLVIYKQWIETRLKYKKAGKKKEAGTFKILINGTFGKLGSRYSILYAPALMIQTTLTGQLCLLMLIEMLEAAGISVVSANTDGVVIKCKKIMAPIRDAIVKRWEFMTGFETEANAYMALFSRDVNNYMAFKPGPPIEVKSKGAYASTGLAKNPTNAICIEAVEAFIIDGVPLETTIRRCADIRKFITVRDVKGGGKWVKDTMSATTIKGRESDLVTQGWLNDHSGGWYEPCGDGMPRKLAEAHEHARTTIPSEYLGKVVRWYYGQGQRGHIAYASNGNLVARSEGAKPIMTLPDVLPPDIDYAWYVGEAKSILRDINCC